MRGQIHQRLCIQDKNKTMFQLDVTGYHVVKYHVRDPESKPQKGHYRWGGPQEAAGEMVRGWEGSVPMEANRDICPGPKHTKASHLDFQYYLQLIVYESTKMHGQYWATKCLHCSTWSLFLITRPHCAWHTLNWSSLMKLHDKERQLDFIYRVYECDESLNCQAYTFKIYHSFSNLILKLFLLSLFIPSFFLLLLLCL